MGSELIRALQSWSSPPLDLFFIAATLLGSEEVILVIVSLTYWLGNRRLGLTLGVFFCLSGLTNQLVKDLCRLPRPSPAEVRVLFAASGTGYGFPSGHTQNGTVFWGALTRAGKIPLWAAVALVGLIGVSRLYLGLHFPRDVLGGALLGVALLWGFSRPAGGAQAGPDRRLWWLAGLGFLISLLLYRTEVTARVAGGLAGMAAGYFLEAGQGEDRPRGGRALVRVLLGLGILAGLQLAAGRWLPAGYAYAFGRYAVLSLAGFGLLPRLFRRLGC